MNDKPQIATVCATPGVSRDRHELRRGFLGTLERRRIGQLDVHDQPALVLLGYESGGGLLKDPVGRDEQAAVDQQHHQAEVEQFADCPAIEMGHPIEPAVEAAEEPSQHGVDGPDQEPPDRPAGHRAGNEPDGPSQVLVRW